MQLPQIDTTPLPSYKLSQKSANKLVGLYYEMLEEWGEKVVFDQEDCEVCVIGNGIKRGFFKPRVKTRGHWADISVARFSAAVISIGLPMNINNPMGREHKVLQEYLFGGVSDIIDMGEELQMPQGVEGTIDDYGYEFSPLDAAVRIAAVLDRGGYDITELSDIPQS